MGKYTYFAVTGNESPVEVDDELALSLYVATKTEFKDGEKATVDHEGARAAFEAGERSNVDEDTYIYGTTLTEKERFKMALKEGIQTTEEFREKRKQG
jgi:hypothetical protein